jgi:methyl-accepting chemotaxis protein
MAEDRYRSRLSLAAERAAVEDEARALAAEETAERGARLGLNLSFRARLMVGLIAASIIPLAVFGAVIVLIEPSGQGPTTGRILLFVLVVAAVLAILIAYVLAADLTAPLRAIAAAVARASAGDLTSSIVVPGDDELAHLAESPNRLAARQRRLHRRAGGPRRHDRVRDDRRRRPARPAA